MIERIRFHVVGVSHRTAGVEVRERFALLPARLAELAQGNAVGVPTLVLSTCNRSELYWGGSHDLHAWFADFARTQGVSDSSAIVRRDGVEAIRHLFTVASGLDSQILGETEILGQVRRAFDIARASGATTKDFDAIFSAALAAGRRVRRETMLGRHPASVSSAAVDVAAQRLGDIEHRHIVVVGAGEAAEGALRALHEQGATRVTLVNRRAERAQVLADAWGATTSTWAELPAVLAAADAVFVATAAKHPIISASLLQQAVVGRDERPLVVLDLSVPRNVEPTARDLPRIILWDLDDLQRLRCPVAPLPANAIAAAGPSPIDSIAVLTEARRIIEDEMVRLNDRLRARAAGPRLADLHRFGQELAERETAWALAQLEGLSEREREVVRAMADRLVRRVLYPASRAVRGADR